MQITELINTVRKLANEQPQNKYQGIDNGNCSYDRGLCIDGSTGCIFGQAAKILGENWIGKESIYHELLQRNILTTPDQLQWCRTVQRLQDYGTEWKYCVITADRELN